MSAFALSEAGTAGPSDSRPAPVLATTLLEIVAPRLNGALLTPAEHLFAATARAGVALGAEIGCAGDDAGGVRRFYLRVADPDALEMVADQVHAHYPQAQIRAVAAGDDPLRARPGEGYGVVVLDQVAPPYVPLRLVEDAAADAARDAGADPLIALLGGLGRLPPGWRAVAQIAARPLSPGWADRYRALSLEPAMARERADDRARAVAGHYTDNRMLAVALAAAILFLVAVRAAGWWQERAYAPLAALALAAIAALAGGGVLAARLLRRPPAYDHRRIGAKLDSPAFRAEIRLILHAPATTDRAAVYRRLDQLAAAYRQFDQPGGNGLVARALHGGGWRPRALDPLGGARRVPILSARELAALWHLPQSGADLALVERTASRARLPERPDRVAAGCPIGRSRGLGRVVPVCIPDDTQRGLILLAAKTRRGKSSAMLHLALHRLRADDALLAIDPQRDFARDLLGLIPLERRPDVVLIDLGDAARPVGYNPIDAGLGWTDDGAIDTALLIFKHQFPGSWGNRMEDPFRFGLRTLFAANVALCAADPEGGRERQYTIFALSRLYTDPHFRRGVLDEGGDAICARWWKQYVDEAVVRALFLEIINPVLSKINRFLGSRQILAIFGQPRSTIDPRAWLRERKVVIVDGARGTVGEDTSALLGAAFFNLTKLTAAAQEGIPAAERGRLGVFVDEFHTMPAADYADVINTQQKYGVGLCLATQGLLRLDEFAHEGASSLRATIFDNLDGLLAFETSAENAMYLVPELGGEEWVGVQDLVRLGRYRCYCRLATRGETEAAFLVDLDAPPAPHPGLADLLARESALAWGRPREEGLAALLDADARADTLSEEWAARDETGSGGGGNNAAGRAGGKAAGGGPRPKRNENRPHRRDRPVAVWGGGAGVRQPPLEGFGEDDPAGAGGTVLELTGPPPAGRDGYVPRPRPRDEHERFEDDPDSDDAGRLLQRSPDHPAGQ